MDDFINELRHREQECRRNLDTLYREQDVISKRVQEQASLLEHVQALLKAELGDSYKTEGVAPLFGRNGVDWTRLSVREGIQRLLAEGNRAMHADEIRDKLKERGMTFSRRDPKATIVTALIRGARKGLFVKTGPNAFRLVRDEDRGGEA